MVPFRPSFLRLQIQSRICLLTDFLCWNSFFWYYFCCKQWATPLVSQLYNWSRSKTSRRFYTTTTLVSTESLLPWKEFLTCAIVIGLLVPINKSNTTSAITTGHLLQSVKATEMFQPSCRNISQKLVFSLLLKTRVVLQNKANPWLWYL